MARRGLWNSPGFRPSGVVRDNGSGLGKGLKLERARHRAEGQPDLEDSLDIFHTFREVAVPCGKPGQHGQPRLERAEAAQKELNPVGRAGESRTGHATSTSRMWRQAEGLGIRRWPPRGPGS